MAKYSNYLFKLDLLILSVLKHKDMYGYELSKVISDKTNGYVVPKHGTMYPVIYKLIEDGYITSHTVVVKNKARVYYHLEEKGKKYLQQLVQDYDNLVLQINNIVHGGENNDSK